MSSDPMADQRGFCKSMFEALDVNGTGWLTRKDMESALPNMDIQATDEQLESIMNILDPDRDGKISFDDFFHGFVQLAGDSEAQDDVSDASIHKSESNVSNISAASAASAPEKSLSPPRPTGPSHSPRSPGHKKNAMSMASPKVDERAAQAMNRMVKRATLSRGSSLSNLRKSAETNAIAMNAHRNKTAADDSGAHTRSSSKHSVPASDTIDEDEEFNDVVGNLRGSATPPESPTGGRNALRSGRLGQSLGGRARGQTVAGDHDFAAHEFKHSKHRAHQPSEDFLQTTELAELERFLGILDEPTSRDDERVDAKFQIREEFRRKISSYDVIKDKHDKLNVSVRHLDSENARLTEEISKSAQRYRDLESKCEELQFRLQDARGDFSVAYGKVPTLEKEILELQQELENQKALLQIERKNKRQVQAELENVNAQLKAANEKLRSRPSASVPREPLEIVQKYKEAIEKLTMLEEENQQLAAQLEQVEGDRAEQERIIQSLQEQGTSKIDSDSVLDELSQLRLKDQELARRFSTLEAQHSMATDQSKIQIDRLEGQINNLTKQLEDSKLLLAGRDTKIESLERTVSGLQMQVAERDSQIERLKKLHAEQDKRKEDDLNDERKRHREREDMFSREQSLLQQQLNQMREQLNLTDEQKERERQRADTIQAALQQTSSELQARLAKLASGVDEAVQVRLDDEEAREKLDKETSARVAAESRIRELEAEVARLRAEVKRLEEELARVNGDIDRLRADQRAKEEAERLERERREKEKRDREEKERLEREAREREEAEKKKAGIQMTDDNLDTLQAFARYFNGCLSGDRELKELGLFPIDATGTDFLTKLRDGVLLAKFINCAVPNTIDERALNRPSATTVMNSLKIVENLNLVLSAATSIGVGTKRIGISAVQLLDPTNQEHHRPILDFLWQLIYTKLTAPVSVRVHPELSRVIKEQGGKVSAPNPLVKRPSLHNFAAQSQKADTAEALALSPAELLNRWFNYHLKSFGLAANNLDKDLASGKLYLALLTSIQYFDKTGGQMETPAPSGHVRSTSSQLRSMLPTIDENDEKGEERANEVIERCADLGISTFGMVTTKHIAKGHSRFNLALVALIFASKPALPPITAQETQEMQKAGLLLDDGGDDREERAFRMWMNSSGLKKHINHLFVDCRDGIALLQMVEHVHPGLVNWKDVSIDPGHPLQKIGNLNQVIDLAKKLRLSVVGIGGNDLYDMNRKLVLALVWQLMRHHIVQFIQQLHHKKFGNQPANDELIIKWANDRVAESGGLVSGQKLQMTGFNDKNLSSSIFFLDLLASVEPRVIDRSLVTPGVTAEEKLLNAGYTISVARKLGATIFLLPEDIVETKPKMIMTLVASIMAISTTDDVMNSESGSSNTLETLAASVSAPEALDELDEDSVGPMVRSQTTNAFPVRQRSSSHIGVLSHTRQPSNSKLTARDQT